MAFSNYSWKYCPDTGVITVAHTIFYQGGTIVHGTHVPGPVAQASAKREYNSACNVGTDLAHFRMLIHILLDKDPYMVSE